MQRPTLRSTGPRPALWVLAATLAAACSVDEAANPAMRCDDAGACALPLVCHRGFCVEDASAVCVEGATEACWEGDGAELAGVGACDHGARACAAGAWGLCLDQTRPTAETCNGVDDDCDGFIDEFADEACDSDRPGVCAAGLHACQGGLAVCVPSLVATHETCNALDDDCDGEVDELVDVSTPCFPDATVGCLLGAGGAYACQGLCSSGMTRCRAGGGVECVGAVLPLGATDTICDGVDDDCDGAIDEDCACVLGATQDCYGGPAGTGDAGRCRVGTQSCVGGVFGACVGEVRPALETCANPSSDDDCDGMEDDVAGLGAACIVPAVSGVCTGGVLACTSAAAPTCTPRVTPGTRSETCNGLDDDCDGTVDEGFDLLTDGANCGSCGRACSVPETCSLGLCCAAGLVSCGGVCVDLQADVGSCGACGNSCGAGGCCAGVCIDLAESNANCGACGSVCASTRQCSNAVCCRWGETGCGTSCVDTRDDDRNCGGCGIVCSDRNGDCCSGSCGRC